MYRKDSDSPYERKAGQNTRACTAFPSHAANTHAGTSRSTACTRAFSLSTPWCARDKKHTENTKNTRFQIVALRILTHTVSDCCPPLQTTRWFFDGLASTNFNKILYEHCFELWRLGIQESESGNPGIHEPPRVR